MELPKEVLSIAINRGDILHSNLFNDINHAKFFVVIGVTDTEVAGFFYINSNINFNCIQTKAQRDLQYRITKEDYPFLDHDSYIGGANIIRKPKSWIVDGIISGSTQIKDHLKQKHIDELLDKLRNSKVHKKADIKDFFY